MLCCHNKLTKCEKLGKCLSSCTRDRAITDNYSPCITYVYTKHIIYLTEESESFTVFIESMKTAILWVRQLKLLEKKLRKGGHN